MNKPRWLSVTGQPLLYKALFLNFVTFGTKFNDYAKIPQKIE
ncbi:hypothetical protein [Neobacillus niacini]|nr:hypothetical protein [Neobacillus niacini]